MSYILLLQNCLFWSSVLLLWQTHIEHTVPLETQVQLHSAAIRSTSSSVNMSGVQERNRMYVWFQVSTGVHEAARLIVFSSSFQCQHDTHGTMNTSQKVACVCVILFKCSFFCTCQTQKTSTQDQTKPNSTASYNSYSILQFWTLSSWAFEFHLNKAWLMQLVFFFF